MINKIIFINYELLSNKIRKDYLLDYLIEEDFNVEYWDITFLLTKQKHFSDSEYISIITSYNELNRRLKLEDQNKTILIPMFYPTGNSIKLFRCFTKSNLKMGFFSWGVWPSPPKVIIDSLNFSNFSITRLKGILLNQISKIYIKIKLIKEFDFVFAAGRASSLKFPNSIIQHVNLPDVILYNEIRLKFKNNSRANYCVFLDNNAAGHPDVELLNGKLIDFNRYVNELNHFFDKIEKQYGCKVIIASHPSSNYDRLLFDGREIVVKNTAELVRDASFVLSSLTTSISYAILFDKPLIFFYTNEMVTNYRSYGYPHVILYLSEYLNCPVYNISNDFLLSDVLNNIPDQIRQNFIDDYYTSENSINSSNGELVKQFLTKNLLL